MGSPPSTCRCLSWDRKPEAAVESRPPQRSEGYAAACEESPPPVHVAPPAQGEPRQEAVPLDNEAATKLDELREDEKKKKKKEEEQEEKPSDVPETHPSEDKLSHATTACTLSGMDAVHQAVAEGRLLRADALRHGLADDERESSEDLRHLAERASLVRQIQVTCKIDEGTWARTELEAGVAELWHSWKDGSLQLLMRYESAGSLEHQLGCIRDGDLLEPLWGGSCWDMRCQHAEGKTLVSFKEKTPLIGRCSEVMLERFFCNCLEDAEHPCWVVVERTPAVEDIGSFSGEYRGCTILPARPGAPRYGGVFTGRLIKPMPGGRTQVTTFYSAPVPAAVRWCATDYLIGQVARPLYNAAIKSWARVLEEWSEVGMPARLDEERAFYDVVRRSSETFLCGKQP